MYQDTAGSPRAMRGMTLIELLIVVVIIGLTAAMVAPKIDYTSYRMSGAMQALGTTLVAAQRSAVTRQHDVIVGFDATARTLRVHDDANNNGTIDAGEHVTRIPLGESAVFGQAGAPPLPAGAAPISFTQVRDGLPAVTFHRDGSASQEGAVYITSTRAVKAGTKAVDARAVVIERSTGRVSWFRYNPPTWKRGF